MSRKASSAALPDLEDAVFTAKLRPLGDAVLPKSRQTDSRITGNTDNHTIDKPDYRKSRQLIAQHIESIEQSRGPKRRFEYLIPVRVGNALATDAASKGQSAATRLLEVLRDAGYPVKPEDFIDLRKEKRT